MGLQINLAETSIGVPAPEAYVKISNFNGDKDSSSCIVEYYMNQAARESASSTIDMQKYRFNSLPTGDILPGLYELLKTQEGFEDAIDV